MTNDEKYWRIRLKDGNREDFTREAWERGEVGVWYGAWNAEDFKQAWQQSQNGAEVVSRLNQMPAQEKLSWKVPKDYVDTVRRFCEIREKDWVVIYLSDAQEIGLARVLGPLSSDVSHPFNTNGEVFKYRKIGEKKSFKLRDLPDAYRLLPSQGRGNIHEFTSMWEHVRLLAENPEEQSVNRAFSTRPFDELLDFLGASAWESFCYAYLILEKDFVPTGLSIGRTLPVADIVGRCFKNGSRVVAQCKKSSQPLMLDEEFRRLAKNLAGGDSAYFFAFGGCVGEVPKNVVVVDRKEALKWAKTANGRRFKEFLLPGTT